MHLVDFDKLPKLEEIQDVPLDDPMKVFKVGEKATIIHMPEKGKHLLNEIVTVIPMGGHGIDDDDICVRTDTGMMMFLKESQLRKISG